MKNSGNPIDDFWQRARVFIPDAPMAPPVTWAFGATPQQADALLALVLDGTKTGTAGSLWDYEAAGESVAVGDLSIVLDGRGRPRAVLQTTDVTVVSFPEVTEEHAWSEGEGGGTLAAWREIHERYWRTYSENPRGFEPDMPVVCERFVLLYHEDVG